MAYWQPFEVKAGQVLKLGNVRGPGVRAYIAVRGGIDVPPYLGSRSTFTLGKFGGHAGRALRALKRAGLEAFVHVMPAGEAHKTLASVKAMYRAFSAHGMERRSAVIALGSGVVGTGEAVTVGLGVPPALTAGSEICLAVGVGISVAAEGTSWWGEDRPNQGSSADKTRRTKTLASRTKATSRTHVPGAGTSHPKP